MNGDRFPVILVTYGVKLDGRPQDKILYEDPDSDMPQ
jgi:hypothetical protein